MVVASVYAQVTGKYDVLSAGWFQTIQKPQAVESSINKSSWPVNPVVVPVSGPAPLVYWKPANAHELSKIWTLKITHSGLKLARRAITDGRTVPMSLNSNESSVFVCHQRSQPDSDWRLSSFPLAQVLTDVSQLHSTFITETFAKIMIKTLASCNFNVIRDILARIPPPFAINYQSSTWQVVLPLFKQLASEKLWI